MVSFQMKSASIIKHLHRGYEPSGCNVQELQEWCGDVPHDHARAIRCLQDHQERPGFGQSCREELVHHEEHAASDYRRA